MTIEKHDLAVDFPELRGRIHELKLGNAHFARLYEEYEDCEHQLRRIAQEIETPSDFAVEALKKRRCQLKDQLYCLIQAAPANACVA